MKKVTDADRRSLTKTEKQMHVICGLLLLIALGGLFFETKELGMGNTQGVGKATGFLQQLNSTASANNQNSKHPLTLILGSVVLEETTINQEFKIEIPPNITREKALFLLLQAEQEKREMESYNLTTQYISDKILEAQRAYIGSDEEYSVLVGEGKTYTGEKGEYTGKLLTISQDTPSHEIEKLNYSKVFFITKSITLSKEQVYRLIDELPLLEEKEQMLRKKGVDTEQEAKLIKEAKLALTGERYQEAEAYLKEAGIQLDKRRVEQKRLKGLIRLSKSFFARYWWKVLPALVVLSLRAKPAYLMIRKKRAKAKLKKLTLELSMLDKLLKKTQQEYFVDHSMSQSTYNIREKRYRERRTKIKEILPVLESIVRDQKHIKKEREKAPERRGVLEIKKEER